MLSTRIVRTLSICALVAMSLVAARASAAPDLSTPKKAGLAFAKAVEAGDMETVKAASTGEDEDYKNVQMMSDFIGSFKGFQAALTKKFGDAAKLPQDMSGAISKEFEAAEEKIDGDTATLVMKSKPDDKNPPTLKKGADGWKIDLKAMSKDPEFGKIKEEAPKMIAAIKSVTKDIEAGKFPTMVEAFQAFGEAMQKAAAGAAEK